MNGELRSPLTGDLHRLGADPGARRQQLRTHSAALGDQLEHALMSVPLNVAEGAYSGGRNRRARYQTAAGSAREALACLETAQAFGWARPLKPDLAALF